jgi:hypothetical protein
MILRTFTTALLAALFSFPAWAQTSVTPWYNGAPVSASNPLPTTLSGGGGAGIITALNDTATGTTLGGLVTSEAPGTGGCPAGNQFCAVALSSNTQVPIGVVIKGAGTSGSATIANNGVVNITFSGSTTANDYVTINSSGSPTDAGTSPVAPNIGIVQTTGSGAGVRAVLLTGGVWASGSFATPGGLGTIVDIRQYGADATGTNSSTTAFNTAFGTAYAYTFVPCGTYLLSTNPNAITANGVKLIGAGRDCVTIKSPTTSGNVFAIGDGTALPNAVALSGFELMATATHTSGAAILVTHALDADIHDVEITYDGTHTFYNDYEVEGSTVVHLHDFYFGRASNACILLGNVTLTQDTFISQGMLDTCEYGWEPVNTSGIYMHDVDAINSSSSGMFVNPGNGDKVFATFLRAVLSDTSNAHNWLFQSSGTGFTANFNCTDCWGSSSVTGTGVFLNDANSGAITFDGLIATNNYHQGVVISAAGGPVIIGAKSQICGNSQAGSASYDGIYVGSNINDVMLNGSIFGACNQIANNQRYGVNVGSGTGDYITIANDILTGNVTGPISFNATGAHNIVSTPTLTITPTLAVGTSTPAASIAFATGDIDGAVGPGSNWSSGLFTTFGPNVGTGTGSGSTALGVGCDATNKNCQIISLAPNSSWEPLLLRGSIVNLYGGSGGTLGLSVLSSPAGALNAPALPTSAGSGGIYVCVDSSGNLYKKSSCP